MHIRFLLTYKADRKMSIQTIQKQFQSGFSLIELMISLLIGSFLMAGVFTVYINSLSSQDAVQDQVTLTDNSRFALETLAFDLRHGGLFGRHNEPDNADVTNLVGKIVNDCSVGWAMNIISGVYAYNDNFSDSDYNLGTCIPDWSHGDVIEIRYTLGTTVPDANLLDDKVYALSNVNSSVFFIGKNVPTATPVLGGLNYPYVLRTYYINKNTEPNDGIPSLHRLSLVPGASGTGPTVNDELLLAGVEDLQIQIGLDPDNDGTVNTYVEPGPRASVLWRQARSIIFWMVIRSSNYTPGLDTTATFTIAGTPVTYSNDGYRRTMVSTVVKLRNTKLRSE